MELDNNNDVLFVFYFIQNSSFITIIKTLQHGTLQ